MKNIFIKSLFIVVFLTVLVMDAEAQVFAEGSDASALIASATVVPGGTLQITGDIINTETDADVDIYEIEVPNSGLFTIEVIAVDGYPPDMNLIVFNSAGQGLAGDDDDNNNCDVITSLNSLDSCLTLDLTAGTYYIAVGDNNIGAFESILDYEAGTGDFIDNDSGILVSPTTEVAVIVGTEYGPSTDEEEGDYIINLGEGPTVASIDAVPVPATSIWMLVSLLSLIGFFAWGRLRTN